MQTRNKGLMLEKLHLLGIQFMQTCNYVSLKVFKKIVRT